MGKVRLYQSEETAKVCKAMTWTKRAKGQEKVETVMLACPPPKGTPHLPLGIVSWEYSKAKCFCRAQEQRFPPGESLSCGCLVGSGLPKPRAFCSQAGGLAGFHCSAYRPSMKVGWAQCWQEGALLDLVSGFRGPSSQHLRADSC